MIPIEYVVYAYLTYGVLLELVAWDLGVELVRKSLEDNPIISAKVISVLIAFCMVLSIVLWPILVLYVRYKRANRKLVKLKEGKDLDDDD